MACDEYAQGKPADLASVRVAQKAKEAGATPFLLFVLRAASTANYRIREVAETVSEVMPSTRVSLAEGSGPDKRSYQVDCTKLAQELQEARRVDDDLRPAGARRLGLKPATSDGRARGRGRPNRRDPLCC